MKPKTPTSDQHREFVKAARELGTDESVDAFDKVLKKIAAAPPPKSVQKRKLKKRAKRGNVAGAKRGAASVQLKKQW